MIESKKKEKDGLKKLNIKEKLFCKYYTDIGSKTFCNGTQSYIKAFKTTKSGTARTKASLLLTKDNIIHFLENTYEEIGLNETTLDRELLKVIKQDDELGAKVSAIKHGNDLLTRIEKAKQKALNNKEVTKDVLVIKLPE